MMTNLVNELYRGVQTLIPVNGSPEEAATMLRERTRRWAGLSFMDQVVGSVVIDRVVLRRSHASLRNAFAPIFRGRFVVAHGRTHLTGRFALRRAVQVFMTVWFGFSAVFCVMSLVIGASAALDRGAPAWLGVIAGAPFALGGIALGLLGFGFVRCSKRLSKADVEHITQHVKSTFTENERSGDR